MSTEDKNLSFAIEAENCCGSASKKIKDLHKKNGVDIIFLDIKLPPSEKEQMFSGEDLGVLIKELLPNSKIIISTTYNDNFRIHNIIKNLNPDGFLIKNDITPEELIAAIKTVINDPPYYSQTVVKLLRKHVSNNLILDKIDRQLLYEISNGTKMKQLPLVIPLSIAGIEKRKRHLKQIFEVEGLGDKGLVHIAKEKGFI